MLLVCLYYWIWMLYFRFIVLYDPSAVCICGKDKERDGSQQWFFLRCLAVLTSCLLSNKRKPISKIISQLISCHSSALPSTAFLPNQFISSHTNIYIISNSSTTWFLLLLRNQKYRYYGVKLCYYVNLCHGVNSCYCVNLCYGVISCYGPILYYGVSPCYGINLWLWC